VSHEEEEEEEVVVEGLHEEEEEEEERRGAWESARAFVKSASLQHAPLSPHLHDARLSPLIFTMRAIDSRVKLGERMSKEERARVRDTLGVTGFSKDNFQLAQVLHFTERIPRDLLFIIRTQNLVRSLCQDLGFEPRQVPQKSPENSKRALRIT
jgi:hypothetical protein